jgi:hypothetical protein
MQASAILGSRFRNLLALTRPADLSLAVAKVKTFESAVDVMIAVGMPINGHPCTEPDVRIPASGFVRITGWLRSELP